MLAVSIAETPPKRQPQSEPTANRNKQKRRFLWRTFLLLMFGCIALIPLHRVSHLRGISQPILVSGPSMTPTLWGPARRFRCPECRHENRFYTHYRAAKRACARCGHEVDQTHIDDAPADRVLIDTAAYRWRIGGLPLRNRLPRRGDLVAIQDDQPLRVKRVLAVPGDRIEMIDGKLRINGQTPGDGWSPPPPRMLIHEQPLPDFPPATQPSPEAEPPARISATRTARWQWHDKGTATPSLRYHHFAAYDGRPAAIRDECPFNRDIVRGLHDVQSLQLTLQGRLDQQISLRVLIWTPRGAVVVQRTLRPAERRWQIDTTRLKAQTSTADDPAAQFVDARHPVALLPVAPTKPAALAGFTARLERLPVWFVAHDQQQAWPARTMQVPPGNVFVVGDNQPVSLDSRAAPQGVPFTSILGRVHPR